MKCPICGSENVQVQLVEAGQQTNKKGVGFGGRVNNTARGFTATINDTMGICQNCGNTWVINKGKFSSAPTSIFR